MKLEHIMDMAADIAQPHEVGAGPIGTRQIFDVTGGTFSGPRLRGKVAASGADWLLVDAAGMGRIDVRATLLTDDGAAIYAYYGGLLELNEAVTTALANAAPTDFGDAYFMTQPRFETGDERYAWLNGVVAVAEGRLTGTGVAYHVYAARHG